jgi:hypothetical protein
MKSIALLTFCICFVLSSFGQSGIPGPKLSAAYSNQKIASLENSEIIKLNFMADHLCIIQDATDKNANHPTLNLTSSDGSSLPADVTTESFNPLLYGIEPQLNNQYYSIANGTKTLFVYSTERFEVLYERFLVNQN